MTEKERARAKRATMGFQILESVSKQEGVREYKEICKDRFESLAAAERHIKKNVDIYNGKTIVIAHLKKEIKVSTETKAVAKLEEVK